MSDEPKAYPTIEEMREWVASGHSLITGDFCSLRNTYWSPCGVCAMTAAAILRGEIEYPDNLHKMSEGELRGVESRIAVAADAYFSDVVGINVEYYYNGFDGCYCDDPESPDYLAAKALQAQCAEEGLLANKRQR